jgi:hypothetical protein
MHEMSSLARTLGSWVRIPLEAWMYVHTYSVFVLSFVVTGLETGWTRVQEILPTVYNIHSFRLILNERIPVDIIRQEEEEEEEEEDIWM